MADVTRGCVLPGLMILSAQPLAADDEEELSLLSARQVLGGRYFWILFVYSVLLLSATGVIAARRHLWWDEVEVSYIAQLGAMKDIARALNAGLDWQPPTYYIPLSYLTKWFGASSLVLRSVAILPYWLATLIIYFAVARRTSPMHGFLAMLLPTVTLAFNYSFEARPYALMLFFSACAFLFWQFTQEKRYRRGALAGLALSLAAAFAVHYNACLVAVPLLAGEAIRAARRRALDFPVLISIACCAAPAIVLYPNMLAHRNLVVVPAYLPLANRTLSAYKNLFSDAGVLGLGTLAILIVWFAWPRLNCGERRVVVSKFEMLPLAVSGVFLLIPAMFSVVSHFTQTFYPRYVLESVIGASIFLGLAVHGVSRAAPRLSAVLLTVLAAAAIVVVGVRLHAPDEIEWGTFGDYSDLFDRNAEAVYDSADPILLGQGSYMIALRYGDEDLRKRAIHPLDDTPSEMPGYNLSDRVTFKYLERLLPGELRVPDYSAFKQTYRQFLMYDPDAWIVDRLLADGAEIKLQKALHRRPLYAVSVKARTSPM